jgi:hypothetical protein
MATKSKTKKQPWWAKAVLLVFFLANGLMVDLLRDTGLFSPPEGIQTFAAYAIFAQASGLLVALVLYFSYRGAQAYNPKGSATDYSHIWVDAKSGQKVSDASVKAVYEKQHGYGSWEKKVKSERGCVTVFAIIAAVLLTAFGFYWLSYRAQLPLLSSVRVLLGSGLLYWASWVVLAALGCLAIFMVTQVFYDLLNYNTSLAFSPSGMPMGFENDPPSTWVLLPKFIALVLTLLLNLTVLIFIFVPGLREAPVGRYYPTLIFLTFGVSGVLWLSGVVLQDIKISKEEQRRQDQETLNDAIKASVEQFFGKDTEIKARLASGWVLINNQEKLTPEGRKGVIDVLKLISGKDFGTDYKKWEEWLMQQIMNK